MHIKSLFSQRDPKWAAVKIGQSNLTIGKAGCVITNLAMLTDIVPDKLAKSLKFTTDAKIIWSSCIFSNMKFEWRAYNRDDKKIQQYTADPQKAVIVEVNNGAHWVVPVAYFPDGSYICADPWTGTYENLLQKYHNITGASYFNK